MLNKQNNYAPAWTDARCAELEILQTLLREVSSINNGSYCLGRIARCIELAKQLNSGSLRDGTESFHRFLCNLAIAERKSNELR